MTTTQRRAASAALLTRAFTRSLLLAGACVTANHALPAQRTWIVDVANGPGTHFTNLPPAITAAADGDLILVRSGTYFGASTGKALTILGEGARLDFMSGTFTVAALPAGRDFVLKGFVFDGWGPQVSVQNCEGRVLLDDLTMTPFQHPVTAGPAISIHNSRLVTVHGVSALGSPALLANASTVHVTNSTLSGPNAVLSPFRLEAQPGLRVIGGRIDLTNSGLRGGNGVIGSGLNFALPSPALVADGTSLRLAGSSTALTAGGAALSASALFGTLGSLRLDPAVVLTPSGSATPIGGTIAVQTTTLPALSALGARRGGTVTIDLFAPAGDIAALVVGQPADLLPLPMFGGELGIDPARMLPVLSAAVAPNRHLTVGVPIPDNIALRGSNWVWQSLSGNTTRGFVLSNRANYTVP